MDRQGRWNYKRFPTRKEDDGYHCRICGQLLIGRKTSFCNQKCLRDFYMKTDWQRVRRVIYERDGGVCMKCGRKVPKDNFHVDHIIPIVKGGAEWNLENLELSCPECNLKKGDL